MRVSHLKPAMEMRRYRCDDLVIPAIVLYRSAMKCRRTFWFSLGLHVLAAGSAVTAPAFAGTATPAASVSVDEQVERGRQLADRLCATCHLNPGQGDKSAANSIPGFTAVANRPGQTLPGIVDWLRSVPPMMPNHRLSQDEMTEIAAFILSLSVTPIEAEK